MKRAGSPRHDDGNDNELANGDALASKKLQKLLDVLRPSRKDSASVADKLDLIVDEWQAEVAKQKGVAHQCRLSDLASRRAKNKLRAHTESKDVMFLVRDAEPEEREQVHALVDSLASETGRAKLINGRDCSVALNVWCSACRKRCSVFASVLY